MDSLTSNWSRTLIYLGQLRQMKLNYNFQGQERNFQQIIPLKGTGGTKSSILKGQRTRVGQEIVDDFGLGLVKK